MNIDSDLCYYFPSVPDVRYCGPLEVVECVAPLKQTFVSDPETSSLYCSCPRACHTATYLSGLSTQPLSDISRQFIVDQIFKVNACAADPARAATNPFCDTLFSHNLVRGSFVQFEIFFSTLLSEDMEVQAAYTGLALLCDVGGAMGLILGSTILTVFEFFDFFVVSAIQAVMLKTSKKYKTTQ